MPLSLSLMNSYTKYPDFRKQLQFIIVSTFTFVFLRMAIGGPPIHSDSIGDLIAAEDCVNAIGEYCFAGPKASMGGFSQGSVWIWFLALSKLAGLTVYGTQTLVLGLNAIGVGAMWLVASRYLSRKFAYLAALLYLALLFPELRSGLIWNPSLLSLPCICIFMASYLSEKLPAPALFFSLGFAFSFALLLHGVAVIILPCLIWFAVVNTVHCKQALIYLVIGSLFGALVSYKACLNNFTGLTGMQGFSFYVAGLATWIIGLLSRKFWSELNPIKQHWLWVSLLTIATSAAWALISLIRGSIDIRFGLPAIPGIALLFVGGLEQLTRKYIGHRGREGAVFQSWVPVIVASCLAFCIYQDQLRLFTDRPGWKISDAEKIAGQLAEWGYARSDLFKQLHASNRWVLLSALSLFEGGPSMAPPSSGEKRAVIVMTTSQAKPHDLPEGSAWITRDGGGAIALLRYHSGFERDNITVCIQSDQIENEICEEVDVVPSAEFKRNDSWYSEIWGVFQSLKMHCKDLGAQLDCGNSIRMRYKWKYNSAKDEEKRMVLSGDEVGCSVFYFENIEDASRDYREKPRQIWVPAQQKDSIDIVVAVKEADGYDPCWGYNTPAVPFDLDHPTLQAVQRLE